MSAILFKIRCVKTAILTPCLYIYIGISVYVHVCLHIEITQLVSNEFIQARSKKTENV